MRAPTAPAVALAALAALAALSAGCLETTTVTCADGRLCPAGTRCDELHARCVFADQLESCIASVDGTRCPIGGALVGLCIDEVCLREACGDGLVTGSEQCDGALAAEVDCTDLGYYQPGPVGCDRDCTYDRSACAHLCGDGVIDLGRESCDGDAPAASANCAQLGYYDSAPLGCNSACRYDTSACTGECGDGMRNGPEACEGGPPPGLQCAALGYDAGTPRCSSLCAADLGGCARFGWAREASTDSYEDMVIVGDQAIAVAERIERRPASGGDWDHDDSPGSHPWLHAVWAAGPAAIFVVGDAGTILRHDGQAWAPMISGTTAALRGVWGRSATDVYAVGDSVALHHDGIAWRDLEAPGGTLRAVGGTGPTDLWAGGDLLLHFDGTTWTWDSDFFWNDPGAGVTAIAVLATDDVLVGTEAGLYRGGSSGWTRLSSAPTRDLLVYGPDQFAVASGTTVRFYDGAGWNSEQVSAQEITAIAGWGPGDLLAIDAQGFAYHGDGVGVARQPTAVLADLLDVWARGGYGFAVGGGGAIVALIDGTWSTAASPSPTSATLRAVWGSAADDVFAVGDGGAIVHFDGSNWSPMTTPIATNLRGVWGSGRDDVYAVGDGGVWRYRGASWAAVTVGPPGAAWSGVWGSGPDDVYITGGSGTFQWNGAAWEATALPGGSGLEGAVGQAGTVVAVVTEVFWWQAVRVAYAGAVTYVAYEPTFRRFAAPGPVPIIPRAVDLVVAGPGDIFAALDNGALVHFDGVAWTQVRTGLFAPLRAIALDGAVLWLVGDGGAVVRLMRWAAPSAGCPRAGAELACDDGFDDDCDLLIDERDPDCSAGGLCWSAPTLGCGETITRTVAGGHESIAATACSVGVVEGPERAFRLAAIGPATIKVTATAPVAVHVVGETAAGACDPAVACLGVGVLDTATQTTTVTTDATTPRYVIVEAQASSGTYTLAVTCP